MIISFNPGGMTLKSEDELEASYLESLFVARVEVNIDFSSITEGFNTTGDRQCLVTFIKE